MIILSILRDIFMVNCLLGPFIFTVVNLKKGPTIPIVLHTAWARALSAIVIVCPHKIKIHVIQIKLALVNQGLSTW